MFETHRTWTTERIALLKNLVDAGLSCGQIAREIGVSRNAVIGKINRHGLSRFKRAPGAPPGRAVTAKLVRPRLVSQRRILHALLVESPLPVVAPPVDSTNRCSLLDLQQGHCRWPISDPRADDFGFCGNRQVDGLPYCPAHARMAYNSGARARVNHHARVAQAAVAVSGHAVSPRDGSGHLPRSAAARPM